MSKYGNKKYSVNGINFDSKMEADYYLYLLAEKEKGMVQEFLMQPKYTIVESFKKHNKTYREMTYTPDFLVRYTDGFVELIDVKGMPPTQQGLIRGKLFCKRYDIPLRWVKWKNKREGWVDVKVWYDPEKLDMPF